MVLLDYEKIVRIVIGMIKEKTGHIVIEADGIGKQPAYPFCTYTVTSPYLSQHRGVYEGGAITEDVDLVFSLTWCSNSHLEVVSLAQQTATYFKSVKAKQVLHDNGLAFIRTDGFGNRDTFITIETERRHGFDMRLRTRVIHEEENGEYFEGIEINNETLGG
ncbi:LIC_12616 family protein [Bacillus vallismortis]|uniref:phage neck terminator protein n=1 Tax=Bacillus vallismortis TaxID=72361 RepID=UPI00227DB100|nr:hypothetical protein [Bacillus vallismortis]MCY7919557.1 hypothetical protein [Bacillus vallismortis]